MDRVLRGQEMAAVTYMPIRHHSPACSYHVSQLIENWEPDCILIEGPENANELIPVMTHQDTQAPFAVYYSYRDSKGYVSEEKGRYQCYYPFLDYSPELTALREAARRGIPAAFMDLPYGEILIACGEGRGLRGTGEKLTYNDDYLLARSAYIENLCRKAGLRSFDELWEKYFEQNGLYEETETFVEHMLAYCRLSRESTPQEALKAEGCLAREQFMAGRVKQAAKQYSRVLVVTGGFHTPGIQALLDEGNVNFKLKAIPKKDQGVYLMPYSMEASASLNGYASGMPYPGFYQSVWKALKEGNETPYRETVLNGIVAAGKGVRKKDGVLSSYDEICAFSMADGLAALRNKREPGAYELLDCVLSSFVKGEYNLSTDLPMRLLTAHMTGSQVGSLCKEAPVPPITQDFQQQCKALGLKTGSTLPQEATLELFGSQKHRDTSRFFHRMVFLGSGFCKKIKGPDLQLKKNRNLIREIWKYKWSSQVVSALIDVSVHGATVEEACVSLTLDRLKKEGTAEEGAILLTHVFEMGLDAQLEQVYDRVQQYLLEDGDFYSVSEALTYLVMLKELNQLYQARLDTEALVGICVRKLIGLLPSMAQVKEEQLAACMQAFKSLYQITGRPEYETYREAFYQALKKLCERPGLHAGLDGCAKGILYGAGQIGTAQIEAACRGYLTGTREQLLQSASFFRGLFYTARDLVFIGQELIATMDRLIARLSDEEFMALLPEFCMAFSYFTPREIDKIAEKAAGLYGKKKKDLWSLSEVTPDCYRYGSSLDEYAASLLDRGRTAQ